MAAVFYCTVLFSLWGLGLGIAVNHLGLLTVLLRRQCGFNMKRVLLIRHGMLLVYLFFCSFKMRNASTYINVLSYMLSALLVSQTVSVLTWMTNSYGGSISGPLKLMPLQYALRTVRRLNEAACIRPPDARRQKCLCVRRGSSLRERVCVSAHICFRALVIIKVSAPFNYP